MQSPGAYALVNAMKNNPESTLIEVELTVRRKDRKETSSPEEKIFSSLTQFQIIMELVKFDLKTGFVTQVQVDVSIPNAPGILPPRFEGIIPRV